MRAYAASPCARAPRSYPLSLSLTPSPWQSGFTALALACKGGFDGCALTILNNDAALESADVANGYTALLWAVRAGVRRGTRTLIDAPACTPSLPRALLPRQIEKCSSTTVKMLCDKGADKEVKSRSGITGLMMAADANNADKVRTSLRWCCARAARCAPARPRPRPSRTPAHPSVLRPPLRSASSSRRAPTRARRTPRPAPRSPAPRRRTTPSWRR